MMTIGTNYRSGSAIVATTGSGSKVDSAMAAIRIINNYKSQEIRMLVRGVTKNRSGSAIVATTGSKADSAMVAIRTIANYNKSGQCHCGHR
jgi:hypothetical protein